MPQMVIAAPRDFEVLTPQQAADHALAERLRNSPLVREMLAAQDREAAEARAKLVEQIREAEADHAAGRPQLAADVSRAVADLRVVERAAANARAVASAAEAALAQHDHALDRRRLRLRARLRDATPREVFDAAQRLRAEVAALPGDFRSWRRSTGEFDATTGAPIVTEHTNGADIAARRDALTGAIRELDAMCESTDSPDTIRREVRRILDALNLDSGV